MLFLCGGSIRATPRLMDHSRCFGYSCWLGLLRMLPFCANYCPPTSNISTARTRGRSRRNVLLAVTPSPGGGGGAKICHATCLIRRSHLTEDEHRCHSRFWLGSPKTTVNPKRRPFYVFGQCASMARCLDCYLGESNMSGKDKTRNDMKQK